MISSLRNILKNYRNIESKFNFNFLTKNFELNNFKLNTSVNAQFHSLIIIDNYANPSLKNRMFQEKEKSFLRTNKFNFNFRNDMKLDENRVNNGKDIF
jgi:hypothetical protein